MDKLMDLKAGCSHNLERTIICDYDRAEEGGFVRLVCPKGCPDLLWTIITHTQEHKLLSERGALKRAKKQLIDNLERVNIRLYALKKTMRKTTDED